ncbi:hypothetical protein J26TS2_30680 [Shouchella clausii]|nr:hypothetical protein J26TS2_30680 [Shouchella clausii]
MTKEIKIDIQRTGFPVKIGSLELWFDSSAENLRRFFNVNELAKERLKEAEEKAKHIHFPDDLEDTNLATYDAAIDVNKEFVAAQYDILFGDGTFKKIYKSYPDVFALEAALEPLGEAIAERVNEMEKERSKKVEQQKTQYLNKKAAKKK